MPSIRPIWAGVTVLCAAFLLFTAPIQAADEPSEGTLAVEDASVAHILMVFDTDDPDFGYLIDDTSKYLVEAVRGWLPPQRTNFRLLKGREATPDRVIGWLREAKLGENDSVFVYFCGHASNDPGPEGLGHVFRLHGEKLRRHDVLEAMGVREGQAARVRSAVLLTDCCGKFEAIAEPRTKSVEPTLPVPRPAKAPRLGPDPDLHRYLFFRHRGVVDVSAARPATGAEDYRGTIAMIYDKEEEGQLPPGVKVGAAFSFQLRQALMSQSASDLADESGAASWEKLLQTVGAQTEAYVKRNGADPESGVQTLTAVTLNAQPEGGAIPKNPIHYRLGLTFEDKGKEVVVSEVIRDTPAEWMGFRAGDVLEKTFGYRSFKDREVEFEGKLEKFAQRVPPLKNARAFANFLDAAPDSTEEQGEWIVCQLRSKAGQPPRLVRVKLNPPAPKE